LATASGAAFSAIVFGQFATAFACRSTSRPVWRMNPRGNRLLLWAVAVELLVLAAMLGVPPVAGLLGQSVPTPLGVGLALLAAPAVLVVDGITKRLTHRRSVPPAVAGPRQEIRS
jgi:magnesium-transporting ATPase (P-type)